MSALVSQTEPVVGVAMGLDEAPLRTSAWVASLVPTQDMHDLLLRLLEIGFLPGERVQVVARGFPGGDPLAVRVGHTTFALRRHEAALVRVSLQPPEAHR